MLADLLYCKVMMKNMHESHC